MASHQPSAQPQQPPNVADAKVGVPVPPRSPSTLFDQSPRITQLLEQISTCKSSLVDLRTQLLDCQTSTSENHALLQEELSSHRERKRVEDVSKLETKSRMKTLEDSKRSAESVKRDADKRLKSVQSIHDYTTRRIQTLDDETAALRKQTAADEEKLQIGVNEVSCAERELADELELKKQEIKEAEDVVAALNQRARELEDQLDEEREKLRKKKGLIENRKSERLQIQSRCSSWSPSQNGFIDSSNRPLGLNGQPECVPYQHLMQKNKLPVFNPTLNGSVLPQSSSYTVSADEVSRLSVASPTGQSLIPSGLIASLDGSESTWTPFQSDTDPYLKECRSDQGHESLEMYRTYDPFSSSKRSSLDGHGYASACDGSGSMQDLEFGRRGPWSKASHGDDSKRLRFSGDLMEENVNEQAKASTKGWLPTLPKDESRQGLNPDAREFSMIPSSKRRSHASLPSFDNLNPTGLGSSLMSSTSTSDSLFLRAFAPSPAEREALQRALGGANTSFERLPSLSDVGGSIPSSPSHIHALPHHGPNSQVSQLELPGWLFTFPRGRKTQFSPWGDEEPSSKP